MRVDALARLRASIDYPDDIERPRVRGDCLGGERPCPFVSCRYHLALDIQESGGVKVNFPDIEVWEMKETCALDVADRAEGEGLTLREVGDHTNLTRERTRQIQASGLRKLGPRAVLLVGGAA